MPAVRELLKKLPKRRGYSFKSIEEKPYVINVGMLEVFFSAGDTVNASALRERGALRMPKSAGGSIKILGEGTLTKKLLVTGCAVSKSARQKIEEAGGSVA
jgi:large subunit ribosomal protein L15